ncbi:hypothetical protein C8R43DRAFT_1173540 [Mycena crocata]|nr:hypothetical protein C8R43DRAFT_1173540 [Mycena crocata]
MASFCMRAMQRGPLTPDLHRMAGLTDLKQWRTTDQITNLQERDSSSVPFRHKHWPWSFEGIPFLSLLVGMIRTPGASDSDVFLGGKMAVLSAEYVWTEDECVLMPVIFVLTGILAEKLQLATHLAVADFELKDFFCGWIQMDTPHRSTVPLLTISACSQGLISENLQWLIVALGGRSAADSRKPPMSMISDRFPLKEIILRRTQDE